MMRDNINFETLKPQAEKLSKNDTPDEINSILQASCDLGAIERRQLRTIIKDKTGISFEDQKKAQAEYFSKIEVNEDHLTSARKVINGIGFNNILSTDAHVWLWRKLGIWQSIPDRELKQIVQDDLEKHSEDVMRSLVDGVTDVLKTDIFRPEHTWNWSQDSINVLNGELHRNGEDWELQPHCREHYLTTQIPVTFDPDAKCLRFSKFLDEIFVNDPDGGAKARALLEMIGYSLTCDTRFERFVILIGIGANGKSVLMEVLRLLAGSKNVAAVQPCQFDNKFQRAHLHLKLVNLVTEIAEGAEIADAELKAIVSGELITAEHKHKPPFDFRPYATCWFGTNHMPHTRDFSDALFRRALIVPFNRTFKVGVDADPDLKEKLAEELPGILNLALQAYGEALKRGSFTDPESCLRAKEEWRIEADQAAQFICDRCELVPDARVISSDLYYAYKNWADEAGITRRLNRKNFTSRLLRLGAQLCKGKRGIRMIAGILLKSLGQDDRY